MTSPVENHVTEIKKEGGGAEMKRVFRFSPVLTEEENRISQSAPCSPKHFGRHSVLEQCIKDGNCKRGTHLRNLC